MLQPGSPAPPFTLPDDAGRETSLASLLTGGPVLLYFYPADFTPGCTREACELRDRFPLLSAAGLVIAGISPQSPESHHRFREHYDLPFTLLSDENKDVTRRYGCDGPFGFGVRRTTYLIDVNGMIREVVRADFRIGRHIDLAERAAKLLSPGP